MNGEAERTLRDAQSADTPPRGAGSEPGFEVVEFSEGVRRVPQDDGSPCTPGRDAPLRGVIVTDHGCFTANARRRTRQPPGAASREWSAAQPAIR